MKSFSLVLFCFVYEVVLDVVGGTFSICLGFAFNTGTVLILCLHPQELNIFFCNQKLRFLPNEETTARRGFPEKQKI